MRISVLGCGRWGSFISWYLTKLGHNITVWGREGGSSFNQLATSRANEYLKLDDSIVLTNNLGQAVDLAEIIIISISAQNLRSFAKQLASLKVEGKPIILCMKGMEETTGKRLTEVCIECGIDKNYIAVWLGPGHIQDFVAGIPNCMLIDSYHHDLTKELATMLNSDLIRFYFGNDIIGSEIGGATKNIIGLCAGVLDGIGFSSLKGPLMSRGAVEVGRLIHALGGKRESAYGLAHLGDYETTLFSKFSNNRAYGESLVTGAPYKKLAEGVATTKAVKALADGHNLDLPIIESAYNVLYNCKSPKEEIERMYNRTQKSQY